MISEFELDELHVISDLHIGGAEKFRIFDSALELSTLIDHFGARPKDTRVGLVINGDFVDFLAEPGADYFDPLGATKKLNRLFDDQVFKPVWKSLRDYLSRPGRYLILVLGNHDLELALPWVRRYLTELLCQGRDSRRGRLLFSTDGTGFRCQVAGASVLCLHGNETDTWNLVDYERLRAEGRDNQFARSTKRWIPNSGTQMVIDVMNGIKREYPFVDLLKPETKAVVPILVALDQTKASRLSRLVSVASRLTWDKARHWAGFLSAEEEPAQDHRDVATATDADREFARLLGDSFSIPKDQLSETNLAGTLLADTERRLREGMDPLDLLEAQGREEMLGYGDAALNWLRDKEVSEVLREALESLKNDPSFEVGHKDETFKRLDQYLGLEIDIVVAGHTHLERAIERDRGGFYYNCGTWARLIRLSPERLSSPTHFQAAWDAIRAGTMEALEACPGLVLSKPAVVSIWSQQGKARSALQRISLEGDRLVLKTIAEH